MTLLKLVAVFIGRRPVTWGFHALILAVAVAVTGAVLLIQTAAHDRLDRDLAGIDLVVGAQGGPLQLVMSAVFQADVPTGNIPLAEAERLAADPLVARAVPVSLGDSLGAARIVGTTPAYIGLYQARLARGRGWAAPMEAVLGAEVARSRGLAVGDAFVGAHGFDPGGHAHDDHPYRVVGVLAPTGAVIDRVILTDLASVWALHSSQEPDHRTADHGAADHEPGHRHAHDGAETHHDTDGSEREVTAVLVQYRSALGAVALPPKVRRVAGLQAASPAREMQRLNALLGVGAGALTRLGQGLLALAALGFVVALGAAVLARRRELALLMALGAGPGRLAGVLMTEGALLGLASGVGGVLLARGLAAAVARWGASALSLPLPPPSMLDVALIGGAVLIGLAASLPAAVLAGRTDPVRTLGDA